MDWVDELIEIVVSALKGDGVLKWSDASGQIFKAKVETDFLELLRGNRCQLMTVGKDTFKEAMLLMSKQQDFDALVLIYSKLDTESLIEQYKTDTVKLAEIARRVQETRDFWVSFLRQAAVKMVCAGLGALL